MTAGELPTGLCPLLTAGELSRELCPLFAPRDNCLQENVKKDSVPCARHAAVGDFWPWRVQAVDRRNGDRIVGKSENGGKERHQ